MIEVQVGDVVYVSYSPVQVGRVVEIVDRGGPNRSFWRVRVKWFGVMNQWAGWPVDEVTGPNESVVTTAGLGNYTALVEEQEKKVAKHRATLDAVKAME